MFGRYRLIPDPLGLTADGVPVAIGIRALALLSALVQADGRPVSFAELANRIWGRANVEVNSVQVQVSALRRALGDDRDLIATVAGYGYRFVASVKKLEAQNTAPAASEPAPAYPFSHAVLDAPHPCARRLPRHLTPFVGRYAELSELLGLMSTARVVTLVGALGLGKTRLAHEVARRVAAHFPDGIGSVTLSPQMPPDSLIRTLAQAIGLERATGSGTLDQFGVAIGARRALLIIDCCQPLRGALGDLLGKLVTIAPELRVIVTGTEPLALAHEQVVAVGPLGTPDLIDIKVEEALSYDAFRLLFTRLAVLREVDRGRARPLAPTDANLFALFDLGHLSADAVAAAAWITRRLSGAPLALELAASAVSRRMAAHASLDAALLAFATALNERVWRIVGTADLSLPPAAAIATMIELHHDAFDVETQMQLRRLGIFSGEFTRRAAIDLLAQFAPWRDGGEPDQAQTHARCEACLDDLLGAGLLEQIDGVNAAVLRLPGPVRLFAIEALGQTNELGRAAAAHARSLAARLSMDWARGARRTGDAGELIEFELDALRAALKWSIFNDRLDIAVSVIEASAPLWRQLSMLPEYMRMIRGVLTRATVSAPRRTREEMRLWKTLASTLSETQAPHQEVKAAWRKVYELADLCADSVYRQQALAGLIECLPETWEMNRAWGARPPREGIMPPRLKAGERVEA